MQTFLTDKSFMKSSHNLDRKRLQSQIYEGIHLLASLLKVEDRLVNPKRSVINHPVAKQWKNNPKELYAYVCIHWNTFFSKFAIKEDQEEYVNYQNLKMIGKLFSDHSSVKLSYPKFISDEVIKIHRSVLIQKDTEFYGKLWKGLVGKNLEMKYFMEE